LSKKRKNSPALKIFIILKKKLKKKTKKTVWQQKQKGIGRAD
jgi:hypothetical protein